MQPDITSFGSGGWVRVTWRDRPYRVLARTVDRDGRRVIADLVVRAEDRVDSGVLKSIPVGWLDGVINVQERADQLRRHESFADEEAVLDALTELEISIDGMAHGVGEADAPSTREPLQRPDGKHPDDFYRRVAEAYSEALQRTNAIAPVLAEEAEVPVATARRWIQEARRRGFLPPARRGRAG